MVKLLQAAVLNGWGGRFRYNAKVFGRRRDLYARNQGEKGQLETKEKDENCCDTPSNPLTENRPILPSSALLNRPFSTVGHR